jgi:hypothetical protein
MRTSDEVEMGARVAYAVSMLLVVFVLWAANTTEGRRWLEDRVDSIRWFANEVKTLRP